MKFILANAPTALEGFHKNSANGRVAKSDFQRKEIEQLTYAKIGEKIKGPNLWGPESRAWRASLKRIRRFPTWLHRC